MNSILNLHSSYIICHQHSSHIYLNLLWGTSVWCFQLPILNYSWNLHSISETLCNYSLCNICVFSEGRLEMETIFIIFVYINAGITFLNHSQDHDSKLHNLSWWHWVSETKLVDCFSLQEVQPLWIWYKRAVEKSFKNPCSILHCEVPSVWLWTRRNGLIASSRISCYLKFESKYPAKMQAHYKTCRGADSMITSNSRPNNSKDVYHFIQPFLFSNNEWSSYIESNLCFFVNEYLHIAICHACQYVVEVESISQHAIQVHKHKVDPQRLRTDIERFQLHQGSTSLAQYRIGSTTLKDPIEGLQILDRFGCRLCIFYSHKLSTLKVHLCSVHGSNCSTEDNHWVCFVQRLSPSPRNNCWFGVSRHHIVIGDAP